MRFMRIDAHLMRISKNRRMANPSARALKFNPYPKTQDCEEVKFDWECDVILLECSALQSVFYQTVKKCKI